MSVPRETALELSEAISQVEGWVGRIEAVAESMAYSVQTMERAVEKNQHAASSMRDAAAVIDGASRRMG